MVKTENTNQVNDVNGILDQYLEFWKEILVWIKSKLLLLREDILGLGWRDIAIDGINFS
jgi:hypothetical protein